MSPVVNLAPSFLSQTVARIESIRRAKLSRPTLDRPSFAPDMTRYLQPGETLATMRTLLPVEDDGRVMAWIVDTATPVILAPPLIFTDDDSESLIPEGGEVFSDSAEEAA